MKKGAHAVHHRARALQAQARAGAGGRSRRPGDAEAGRGRIRAAGRAVEPSGRIEAALDNALANRDSAQAKLKQAQADTRQAEINLGYTQVKAPFDGFVTRAAGVGGRICRRQRPDPARHHRPARSDLRELQHQRAGRPARPRRDRRRGLTRRSSRKSPVEVGLQSERDIRTGHARLRRARPSTSRPARSQCAPSCRTRTRCCCRAISSACACR